MGRAAACLGLGTVLWTVAGAVRGATYWQVSASSYLLALLAVGGLLGLLWPGQHLRTGALLAVPGFAALVTAGAHDHADAFWWLFTVAVGGCGAADSHRLAVELRTHFVASRRGR
jgi:hypothetical protein